MDGAVRIDPFLAGNYAPVADELDAPMVVAGEIPASLVGAFYRNGPNPQFHPGSDYHWFGGDGMIHGVFVENGQARYRNRYVRTPKWLAENAAGRRLFGLFGNPMTSDPSVIGEDGGVANTNIVWHAGRLLALEEGHRPFELDAASLESIGYVDAYGGNVTAHPKIDPSTGEMVWFAYGVSQAQPFSNLLTYGVTDQRGEVIRRETFEAPYCSMVHDFLVTERHALFPVLPLTGSLERAMRGGPPFAWEPDKGGFVGVIDRAAGPASVRWFEVDACYVFHPMNAWEEGEVVFADVMEYAAAPLFPNPDGTINRDGGARLVRWRIDLGGDSHRVTREPLDDLAGEFPRFDERRAGRAYRHGWFAANTSGSGGVRFNAIAHLDHATGRRVQFELQAGDAVGEPVFVPRSAEAGEGDGHVVCLAHRAADDVGEFWVFDALDIAAGPIARARAPRRIPFGFHGNWRPGA